MVRDRGPQQWIPIHFNPDCRDCQKGHLIFGNRQTQACRAGLNTCSSGEVQLGTLRRNALFLAHCGGLIRKKSREITYMEEPLLPARLRQGLRSKHDAARSAWKTAHTFRAQAVQRDGQGSEASWQQDRIMFPGQLLSTRPLQKEAWTAGLNEGIPATWQRRPTTVLERLQDPRLCDAVLLGSERSRCWRAVHGL